ncbi:MAG: GUN4 N-terminal ARM-like repeat domain-containing protein [Cyanobacteria bacterium P01_G01_bin.54]
MSNATPLDVSILTPDLAQLQTQLATASPKKQLAAIATLAEQGERGDGILLDYLLAHQDESPTPVQGRIYQILKQQGSAAQQAQLQAQLPQGVVLPRSERGLDYQPLQALLIAQDYEAADRLSLQLLCQLAGSGAVQRKWLYFSEVEPLPSPDLQTLDRLWLTYSEGKFGFSVQRELWLGLGRNFTRLWDKIAWKQGNRWTRYPNEFIWDLTAPAGHLPLSNQLRGVRTFEAILNHPAWTV